MKFFVDFCNLFWYITNAQRKKAVLKSNTNKKNKKN